MYNAGMSNKKKRAREKRLEEEKNRKKEPAKPDIRRRDPFLSYATGVMLILSAVIAVSYKLPVYTLQEGISLKAMKQEE